MDYLDCYAVLYADIRLSHVKGRQPAKDVQYCGCRFGGVAATYKEAEELARDTVNAMTQGSRDYSRMAMGVSKSNVVLPRIVHLDGEDCLLDAMYEYQGRFQALAEEMVESMAVLSRPRQACI